MKVLIPLNIACRLSSPQESIMSSALPALLMHHLRAAPPPVAEAAAARSSVSADLRVPALWCIINLTVGDGGVCGTAGHSWVFSPIEAVRIVLLLTPHSYHSACCPVFRFIPTPLCWNCHGHVIYLSLLTPGLCSYFSVAGGRICQPAGCSDIACAQATRAGRREAAARPIGQRAPGRCG